MRYGLSATGEVFGDFCLRLAEFAKGHSRSPLHFGQLLMRGRMLVE